jgi:hypothetical protein
MALTTTSPTDVVLWLEDAMKGDQTFHSWFEESALASELQTIREWEVRWVYQPRRVARGVPAHHRGYGRGHIHYGKLLAYLPIIIRQDLTYGAFTRIGAFMVWPVLVVHQQLREFIQCFCNKRNIIPKVDDKYIIIFFKKGLKDSSLICKLTIKNPRTSEEMLAPETRRRTRSWVTRISPTL